MVVNISPGNWTVCLHVFPQTQSLESKSSHQISELNFWLFSLHWQNKYSLHWEELSLTNHAFRVYSPGSAGKLTFFSFFLAFFFFFFFFFGKGGNLSWINCRTGAKSMNWGLQYQALWLEIAFGQRFADLPSPVFPSLFDLAANRSAHVFKVQCAKCNAKKKHGKKEKRTVCASG